MQIKHKTCFLKKMNAVYSHTPTSIDSNSYDFYHHRLSLAYLYISNCFLSSYHRKTCFIVKFGLTYIIYYEWYMNPCWLLSSLSEITTSLPQFQKERENCRAARGLLGGIQHIKCRLTFYFLKTYSLSEDYTQPIALWKTKQKLFPFFWKLN